MDTVCGVGLPELIVLALVGFVVIGPQRSREVALTLGRWLRTVIRSPWWKEFNQIASSMRDLPSTLVRMAELEDELRTVRTDINRATRVDFNRSAGSSGWERPSTDLNPDVDPWGVQTPPAPPPTPGSGDAPSSAADKQTE